MKWLLAAGSGDIYQICRVYRDDESGRWHQPEFTLLEWYRVGWDEQRLMGEAVDVAASALTCGGPRDTAQKRDALDLRASAGGGARAQRPPRRHASSRSGWPRTASTYPQASRTTRCSTWHSQRSSSRASTPRR